MDIFFDLIGRVFVSIIQKILIHGELSFVGWLALFAFAIAVAWFLDRCIKKLRLKRSTTVRKNGAQVPPAQETIQDQIARTNNSNGDT